MFGIGGMRFLLTPESFLPDAPLATQFLFGRTSIHLVESAPIVFVRHLHHMLQHQQPHQQHLLFCRVHFVYDVSDDRMDERRPNGALERQRIICSLPQSPFYRNDLNTESLSYTTADC